jgi:hypothetical protein
MLRSRTAEANHDVGKTTQIKKTTNQRHILAPVSQSQAVLPN